MRSRPLAVFRLTTSSTFVPAALDRTGQHGHEPGANITLGEDDPAPRYAALLHVGGKTLDYRRAKRTK
jgi:hypothetical protein